MEESGEESGAKAHTLGCLCPALTCIPAPCGRGTGIRLDGKGLSVCVCGGHLHLPRCRPQRLISRLSGEGGPVAEVTGVVLPLREHLTGSEDLSGCHRFRGGGEGGAAGV